MATVEKIQQPQPGFELQDVLAERYSFNNVDSPGSYHNLREDLWHFSRNPQLVPTDAEFIRGMLVKMEDDFPEFHQAAMQQALREYAASQLEIDLEGDEYPDLSAVKIAQARKERLSGIYPEIEDLHKPSI